MRFAENGYYIEQYVKCDNCGVLIYDEGLVPPGSDRVFCTRWCIEWHAQASAGEHEPDVQLEFHE